MFTKETGDIVVVPNRVTTPEYLVHGSRRVTPRDLRLGEEVGRPASSLGLPRDAVGPPVTGGPLGDTPDGHNTDDTPFKSENDKEESYSLRSSPVIVFPPVQSGGRDFLTPPFTPVDVFWSGPTLRVSRDRQSSTSVCVT